MKNNTSVIGLLVGMILLCLSMPLMAGLPVWSFTPLTPTTLSLGTNETVTVQYRVTNNSKKPHTLMMQPISGITQITSSGNCASAFELKAPGDSCILNLQVNGGSLNMNIDGGPIVCQAVNGQPNPNQCYQPKSPSDALHIFLSGLSTVGYYGTQSGAFAPLSYTSTNGGLTWALSMSVLPAPINEASGASQDTGLYSISCDVSHQNCSAVGYYKNQSGGYAPLSYTSTNGGLTWSVSTSLLPAPINEAIGSAQETILNSIDCDTAHQNCSAVGYYKNQSGGYAPLSYTSTNGGLTWSVSMSLLSAPISEAIGSAQETILISIDCDTAHQNCSAVGYYKNQSGGLAPLSYTSTNGGLTWSVSMSLLSAPINEATGSAQETILRSIDCDTAHQNCSAVGYYKNQSLGLAPLSYTSTNGGLTWLVSTSLLSAPSDEATGSAQETVLKSIDCDTAHQNCSAVGYYKNQSGGYAALSYTSTNGGLTWTLSTALPLPSDAIVGGNTQYAVLNGISCDVSHQRCSAVGTYRNDFPRLRPLSYTSTNGGVTWTVSAASLPLPSGTGLRATLYSVN